MFLSDAPLLWGWLLKERKAKHAREGGGEPDASLHPHLVVPPPTPQLSGWAVPCVLAGVVQKDCLPSSSSHLLPGPCWAPEGAARLTVRVRAQPTLPRSPLTPLETQGCVFPEISGFGRPGLPLCWLMGNLGKLGVQSVMLKVWLLGKVPARCKMSGGSGNSKTRQSPA